MKAVCIGEVDGCEFWVDKNLFEYWKHSHFILDVTDGFGAGGFSLKTPVRKTFQVQYRLFTKEAAENLVPVKLA